MKTTPIDLDPAHRAFPAFSLTRLLGTVFAPTEGCRVCILTDFAEPAAEMKDWAFLARPGPWIGGFDFPFSDTDAAGLYAGGPKGTRHSRLRGWMRTGADGVYALTRSSPPPIPTGPCRRTCT